MKNRKRQKKTKRSRSLKRKLLKKRLRGLKRELAGKQKMFDFGPFDPNYLKLYGVHPVKQKMKTVAIVDGMPEGMHTKTRVPLANVANNRWVQNIKNVHASPMPFPMWKKNKWVRNSNYMPKYFQVWYT